MDTEKTHIPDKVPPVYADVASYDGNEHEAPAEHTKRVLNARQVQLFSIGGTIGTSIFVAIGGALVHGGPLSLLLGYAFWCSVIFCVNEGQAEMVCLLPIESSFNRFAARWVDRAFGAATSWNYWICMAALLNFEVTAFTAVIGFWTDGVHPVVFPIAMLTAPKAFRTVFVRLILFFVLGSLAVGILVPYNDPILNAAIAEGKPGAARSPYVAALTRLNVPVLPHIINALILTSIFSAGNAFLFNGSRTLHGIALDGFAPRFLRQTNRNGVPWITVISTLFAGCLSFLQVNASTSKVLDWFINVATSAQLVTWIAMSITWIRWDAAMKAQGVSREILPYRSRIQPYGAYYALTMSTVVTFFNGYYVFLKGGWVTADFIFAYGSVFIFLGVYIGAKVFWRSPFVSADEADLFGGKKEVDEYEAQLAENPPATRWQRISRWLF
ncbi:hypothetical protein FS749_010423 [Ceratobasidium sp. UAMH 11750]|nr:hypothetical protein FS749_010423 [Ceratobasidium sp. UAMH 11750]